MLPDVPCPRLVSPTWVFLVASLFAACGGGDSVSPPPAPPPPPPAPVVTTVDVTPGVTTIAADDTVRLTATAKDQAGNPMSGKSATWATATAATATVATDGLVTGVAAGQATITATIDGKQGTAQIAVTPLVRVVLDATAAKTQTVDFTGATITTTAANGLVFVLEIPGQALDRAVAITMTPVTAFKRLPLSGGLVGAVELAPAGLRFNRPATLRIKKSPNVPAGHKLVGLHYEAGGERVLTSPASAAGNEVTIRLAEIGFSSVPDKLAAQAGANAASNASQGSGAGAAMGTPQDISGIILTNSPASLIAQVQLSGLSMPGDRDAILTILRGAFLRSVKGAIAAASTPAELKDAAWQFLQWTIQIPFDLDNDLAPERQQLFADLIAAFQRIGGPLEQQCRTQHDATAGLNRLAMHALLTVVNRGGQLEAAGLDRATVLAASCVQVFTSLIQFPDPAPPNQALPLDLRFGLKLGADPALVNQVFAVTLDVTGSKSDGAIKKDTDALGKLSTQLTPTGQALLTVIGKACVHETISPYNTDVCAPVQLVRGFGGRVINGSVTVRSDSGLAQISDVTKVTGDLTITGVTSTDLRELGLLEEVGGRLTISGLPNLTSLAGLTAFAKVGALQLGGNPVLDNLAGLGRLVDIPGDLTLDGNAAVRTFAGLNSLRHVDRLVLRGSPRVTSLQTFRGTSVTKELRVDLDGLTTLADLNGLAPTLKLVFVKGAKLKDVAGLASTTIVTDELRIEAPELTSVAGLGALQETGSLTLHSNRVTDITLASLAKAGRVAVVLSQVTAAVRLPALRTATFVSVGGAGGPGCGAAAAVSLPVLVSVNDLSLGASTSASETCEYDVSAPLLGSVSHALDVRDGPRNVTLGAVGGATGLVLVNGRTLRSLRLGTVDLSELTVVLNPVLSDVSIVGKVRTDVRIRDNPLLSQSGMTQLARNLGAQRQDVRNNGKP